VNSSLPSHITNFLKFTFEVVHTKKPHIVAAVFTFGREDLIPDMFIEIIKNLKQTNNLELADLIYYFERHIEVDADEHGPLALEMIQQLCGKNDEKWAEALLYSKRALNLRIQFWDGILQTIENQKTLTTAV
jgi:pyrroloquinoline quinone (PQQ) biosynthesis protein C